MINFGNKVYKNSIGTILYTYRLAAEEIGSVINNYHLTKFKMNNNDN